MSKVYIMCGKVGSGKSTYAAKLSEEIGAIILSVDQMMLTVYGREIPCSEHKNYIEKVKKSLFSMGHQILKRGLPIIIDFGFWTKEERVAVRNEFDRYPLEILVLDVDEELLYERVANRNKAGRDIEYHMSKETHKVLNQRFEMPCNEEACRFV